MNCHCKGLGFYQVFWTLAEGGGIFTHQRFLIPCPYCSLGTYTNWIVKNQHWFMPSLVRRVREEIVARNTN